MAPLRHADAQIGAQAYGDKLLRVNGCEIPHTPPLQAQANPLKKFHQVFASKLQYWEKEAVFVRKFTLTGNKSDVLFKASITFMGCDDETCLVPKTENFTFKLK